MNNLKIRISTVFTFLIAVSFAGNQKIEITNAVLKLTFNPSTSHLSGVIEYQFPSDSVIWLTSDLKIESVIADGRNTGFEKENPTESAYSTAYKLPFIPQNLIIQFSGVISEKSFPKTISTLNRVNYQMLELTDVIDWYPRFKNRNECTFSLSVEAPKEFGFVTNGVQTEISENGDIKETRFESENSVSRIFLIGSAGLKNSVVAGNNFSVEIFHTKLPEEYVRKMINNLASTVEFYQNLYQSEGSNNIIKVIYSPRPAGGYARGSVIVVSEEFAFEQIENKWGFSRDFQLNAHEIAHLWSKANWEHDWINEGLAEYSAFLASEKYIGNEFAKLLLEEYTTAIENSATQLSIIETTGDSWENHINRYYKPTVLLNSLCQKYDEEKMAGFIQSLDAAFIQNKGGTTELFLEELKKSLGTEAHDFFSEGLYRKNWNNQAEVSEVVYDPDFQGTWIGSLTQFGTTSKFVLQLKKIDNKLVSSLDSPDQNVYDIPVSGLKISGDSLSCVVGVANAKYYGQLDRKAKSITGTWTQRGTDYPVNLTKEE